MAVTSDPFTNTDLSAVLPEIWSDVLLEPNFPKAVLANFFMNLSEYATEGDTIHVPALFTSSSMTPVLGNSGAARTQSTQGAEITTDAATLVDTSLLVNTHSYVAWLLGDKDVAQLQKSLALNQKYAQQAKDILTKTLEAAIAALWSSFTTNTVGDTATVLSDAEIIQAIYTLDNLNFDLTECAFFLHPFVFWRQLGSIAKYYQQYASQLNFIKDGSFGPMDASRGLKGQVYGIPIYTTTNIVSGLQTYRNIFAHRTAIGYAFGTLSGVRGPRAQMDYLLQNLATLAVCDMVYGVAMLNQLAGVLVNANNAAILS